MLKGIDISSYQDNTPDLNGLDFVFIKVTEGLSYVNPKWVAQRDHARANGLIIGYYAYPHIANSPTVEADYFLKQINLAAGDILCLDWEWYGQNVTNAQARAYRDTWLAYVKAQAPGHRVVLYSDRNNWLNVDTDSNCGDGLWIADYTTAGQPRVQHPWVFHQYSDTPEDLDVANFSSGAALRSWAGVSTPTPTPAPTPGPAPVPQWRRLLDHVMAVPEQVYEHWTAAVGWDNITAFGAEYGEQGQPWCVIFNWCMFHDVDLDAIVPKTDNVADFTAWAQARGQWSEYPSVGAWVDFGNGQHSELVVGFDATTVYTKGGNSVQTGATDNGQGNGVFRHSHARTDSYVTGYFAPRFPDGHCPPTADPHDPRGGQPVASWRWTGPATPPSQEDDMPQWTQGPVVPGTQPTVALVPHGDAWSAYKKRTLHLGMDEIGTPAAKTTVRVAVHDGKAWGAVTTQTVTAAGSTVDVDVTGAVKVSLQTDATGVAYAIESW